MLPFIENLYATLAKEEHHQAVDQVVTNAMYTVAEHSGQAPLSDLISGCRAGAIEAMRSANPMLATVFIHLGAELIATASDGQTTEAAITKPSTALKLIESLA